MAILREPTVYVVGRQVVDAETVQRFLDDNGASWETDTEVGGELLSEMGGRTCYMSFGAKQGRRSNAEYIGNILEQRHGSVLEHAVWTFLITGVSRALTHELIRHRAGWAYCLSGDTLVYSERHEHGKRNGGRKRTLRDLYSMTQTPHGRSRLKLLRLRCLDEATGTFTTGAVAAVAHSGRKAIFEVELEDGKRIRCSRDHRFLTPNGWAPLCEIVGGLDISPAGLAVHGSLDTPVMVNGVMAYKDPDWLYHQYWEKNLDQVTIASMAGVSHHTIRAWLRRHRLQKPIGSWTVGISPWNKNRRYTAGWSHSTASRARLREQKLGPRNPQWRGGITRQAVLLRREIETLRPIVLQRDAWHCRLCGKNQPPLQIHHVLPLWARPDLCNDLDNLVSICRACHRRVNGRELDYAGAFGAAPEAVRHCRSLVAPQPRRTLIPKQRRIVKLTYGGVEDTYDLQMAGPHHNFVANGIVTHNSQLSQRYVDETDTDFVEPAAIAADAELHSLWLEAIESSRSAYVALAERLAARLKTEQPHLSGTARRKAARQAARSVLPNATETKIFVTVNARALRHFIELRGSEHAEPEIRQLAVALLRIAQQEAPNLFGDFSLVSLPDGSLSTQTPYSKV